MGKEGINRVREERSKRGNDAEKQPDTGGL